MLKVKARWSGFNGAPGWTNFFFDVVDGTFTTPEDAAPAATRVHTFFNAIKGRLPGHVQIQIQSDVEVIGPTNGKLLNVHSIAAPAVVQGGSIANSYSAASGMVINWRTAGVANGRRVRGRTFLVPLAGGAYQTDGTINAGDLTETLTAATALLTSPGPVKFGVWQRPVTKDKNGADLAVPIDGAFHQVTSASIPDLAAVLRSRR